jgi:hypothetical protein
MERGVAMFILLQRHNSWLFKVELLHSDAEESMLLAAFAMSSADSTVKLKKNALQTLSDSPSTSVQSSTSRGL